MYQNVGLLARQQTLRLKTIAQNINLSQSKNQWTFIRGYSLELWIDVNFRTRSESWSNIFHNIQNGSKTKMESGLLLRPLFKCSSGRRERLHAAYPSNTSSA